MAHEHAHGTHAAGHDEHHVEEYLTPVPLLVGLGSLLLYLSLDFKGAWLGLGIVAFLIPMVMWVKEDIMFWRNGYVDHGVLPGRDLGWWGMMFFLGTEVMLFASLFAAFFVARGQHPAIWDAAHEHLAHALPLVTVNTLILIASGATLHWGVVQIRKNNRKGLIMGLAATILLGTVFLGLQIMEYVGLINAGITFTSSQFGNAFYGLTGTHAAHVLLGLVFLGVCLVRALMGQFDAKRHIAVDSFAIYWHFVDIVWIGLYFIVYVGVI